MIQDYLLLIISSLLSFFVGRYTTKSKINLENYRLQLKHVYSLLANHFLRYPKFSRYSCACLKDLLNEIISKNIELCPEVLLDMYAELQEKSDLNIYNRIRVHTNISFENLKSSIGLPSQKISSRWKIMSNKEKMFWFSNHIIVPFSLCFIFFTISVYCLEIINILSNEMLENSISSFDFKIVTFSLLIGTLVTLSITKKR